MNSHDDVFVIFFLGEYELENHFQEGIEIQAMSQPCHTL